MGEYVICPNYKKWINLEIDIVHNNGDIYCRKCNTKISLEGDNYGDVQ